MVFILIKEYQLKVEDALLGAIYQIKEMLHYEQNTAKLDAHRGHHSSEVQHSILKFKSSSS